MPAPGWLSMGDLPGSGWATPGGSACPTPWAHCRETADRRRLRLISLIFDPATIRTILDSSAVPSELVSRAPPAEAAAATGRRRPRQASLIFPPRRRPLPPPQLPPAGALSWRTYCQLAVRGLVRCTGYLTARVVRLYQGSGGGALSGGPRHGRVVSGDGFICAVSGGEGGERGRPIRVFLPIRLTQHATRCRYGPGAPSPTDGWQEYSPLKQRGRYRRFATQGTTEGGRRRRRRCSIGKFAGQSGHSDRVSSSSRFRTSSKGTRMPYARLG